MYIRVCVCVCIYMFLYTDALFSLSLTLHWTFHFKRIGRSVSNPIALLLGLADLSVKGWCCDYSLNIADAVVRSTQVGYIPLSVSEQS